MSREETKRAAEFFGLKSEGLPQPPTGVKEAQSAYYREEKSDIIPEQVKTAEVHTEEPPPEIAVEESPIAKDHEPTLDELYAQRSQLMQRLDVVNARIYALLGKQ